MSELDFSELRRLMVQIINAHAQVSANVTGRAALSPRVVDVMQEIPRHEFVPEDIQPYAYADGPLPIGHDKTISQPFIVALMVDLLDLQTQDKVLEVGTGLGYQAAVISWLAAKVYTVDIIAELATGAIERLERLGDYQNIEVRVGNGYYGWSDQAPFDKIIVAAAPEHVPGPLIEQLRPGGRMVLPLGEPDAQQLVVIDKDESGEIQTQEILPVRFAQLVFAH